MRQMDQWPRGEKMLECKGSDETRMGQIHKNNNACHNTLENGIGTIPNKTIKHLKNIT